jgi:putative DNA primase/helicase
MIPGETTIAELARLNGHHATTAKVDQRDAGESLVGPRLVVTSLADVIARPIDWLWEGWIARGKISVLGGHPGDGKSTLAASIAATLSCSGTFPDGSGAAFGRTLFLLAEDALDDTLKPRLLAHGADCSAVFAIEAVREPGGSDRLFSLARHLDQLEEFITANEIALLVIDPITSFMTGSDRNSEGDVRDLLTPLSKMADRTGVAVIAIMHVGKSSDPGRRAVQRLLAATAFGAIARSVLMIAPVPNGEEGRKVLGVVKTNMSAKPDPLEWSRPLDGPIVWHGVSAYDPEESVRGAPVAPKEMAEEFLREQLKGGSVAATIMMHRAKEEGISLTTLRRAKEEMRVVSEKTPGRKDGGWYWRLPIGQTNEKMLTPSNRELSIFSAGVEQQPPATSNVVQISPNPGKILTQIGIEHLPGAIATGEDAHPSIKGGEHLLDEDDFV